MRRLITALALGLTAASILSVAAATAGQPSRADDARCRSYGLAPGSDGYAKCIADLGRDHRSASTSSLADAMKARTDANAAQAQAQMQFDQASSRANLDALDAQVAAAQAQAQQQGAQAMQDSIPH
jgi:hypothetical protein